MKKLSDKKQFRSLKLSPGGVDFTSNDYLGLARSKELHQEIADAYMKLSEPRNGSTGSRLLSGNSTLIEHTERKLAETYKSEAALIFDSGYSANLAVLSTLPQKGDTIIMDELSHASLKDGARLSLATKWSFKHNDLGDLQKKLNAAQGNKWIVVESIYSMDGDESPIQDIIELDADVILDEAHTTGIRNPVLKAGIRIHTFGKAMGIHGACVCSSQEIKNLLINFSRPFIYTTAPSDHSVVSIGCAVDYLASNSHLLQELRSNVEKFRSMAEGIKGWNRSESQIQVVMVPGYEEVTKAATKLQTAGFDVRPILSPTVKEGQERLRICIHTFNTDSEMKRLTDEMKSMGL